MTTHMDDFMLLRLAAGELDEHQTRQVQNHLEDCTSCSGRMEEIVRLDMELRDLASDGAFSTSSAALELPDGDPFQKRPQPSRRPTSFQGPAKIAELLRFASEDAAGVRDRLLLTSRDGAANEAFAELSLAEPGARYGILYALQEIGRQIAGGPVAALRFAECALSRFRRRTPVELFAGDAEMAVPMLTLIGQAHLLAGQACTWTREFERARTHLNVAYRCFASGGGDEVGLAIVEAVEAQRRFFLDRGAEALVLARRAKASFEALGLDELAAKADVAVGSALAKLGREEEAIPLFTSALKVFEARGARANYVGTLNNLATCLASLDRLDEARREYARALRSMSREEDRSFLVGIRYGLAEVLFSAGRYREAATSFSRTVRLYDEMGLTANSLVSALHEVEAWARAGELVRARHRLDLFEKRGRQLGAVEPRVTREIHSALSGSNTDMERLPGLREEAESILRERVGQTSA